jgi:hypothetical protein
MKLSSKAILSTRQAGIAGLRVKDLVSNIKSRFFSRLAGRRMTIPYVPSWYIILFNFAQQGILRKLCLFFLEILSLDA